MKRNEILRYSGRILPTDTVNTIGELAFVMKDLAADTFCVPVVYKHSPLACNLINELNWHSKAAMHSGIKTMWKNAFIFCGRDLVKRIKLHCKRYRYLKKKAINI